MKITAEEKRLILKRRSIAKLSFRDKENLKNLSAQTVKIRKILKNFIGKLKNSGLEKKASRVEDKNIRKSCEEHIKEAYVHMDSADMLLGAMEDFLWIERARDVN